MLVIRKEQIAAFGEGLRRRFESEMAVHLERFFPEPCAAMGGEKLGTFIKHTIDKAIRYGIDRERDVCKFLDVAMALGRDFDKDPRFSWSRDILTDASLVGAE